MTRDLVNEFWTWWNWLWSEAGGAWAAVIAASIAAARAIHWARRTWQAAADATAASVESTRSTFRPVLRPVPSVPKGSKSADVDRIILKNYGRGPAFSVRLIRSSDQRQELALDVIEALGPRENGEEIKRVGRRRVKIATTLQEDAAYRLFYQDVEGQWHETAFDVTGSILGIEFSVKYRGPIGQDSVPERVRSSAAVVSGEGLDANDVVE